MARYAACGKHEDTEAKVAREIGHGEEASFRPGVDTQRTLGRAGMIDPRNPLVWIEILASVAPDVPDGQVAQDLQLS